MSLRGKIVLALVAIAALTTISVGWIGYMSTRSRLIEEVDRSLEKVTRSVVVRRGGIVVPARGVLDVDVQALDVDGEVIDSSYGAPIDPGTLATERVVGRPGMIGVDTIETPYGSARVRTLGLQWGGLQAMRSLAETEAVLADVRRRTLLVVIAVTAGAGALGWIIAGSVAAPLRRLTAAATDVERSGRLDVEVPVRGRDETAQLGTAFNRMLGALAALRADQQRLVQDAGHELRTPLTSVRTNVAVLRRHPDLQPDVRERILDDLDAETIELAGLVEEVVALASGAVDESEPEVVALAEAVETVGERARRRSGRKVVVAADGSAVLAQRSAVERAISNLVDNAIKFDPSEQPIEIRAAEGRVDVADRGPGLGSAEEMTRMFDRFHRAESARSLPGSGLGLSIVRDIAERGGGGVVACNRDGGGAVVGFWLPTVPPQAAAPG
jgi:two-component system sensor histidine kinase MprB